MVVEEAAHCSIISFHQGKIIVVEFLIAYASFRSWDKKKENIPSDNSQRKKTGDKKWETRKWEPKKWGPKNGSQKKRKPKKKKPKKKIKHRGVTLGPRDPA